jgi:hypothetical protein
MGDIYGIFCSGILMWYAIHTKSPADRLRSTELVSEHILIDTRKEVRLHDPTLFLLITIIDVRFEVFTAVTMKNGVFWVVTPCGSCKNRRFGET